MFQIGTMYHTDVTETTEFILDKIEAEEIDFYQSTRRRQSKYNGTGVFRYLHRKAVPPLWPRARQTIVVDPTMHIVMPPDWPTTIERLELTPPPQSRTANDVYLEYPDDNYRPKLKSRFNRTAMSPMKRRSINNVKLLNNSGSVILKILNGKGRSMIEIKVGSDNNIRKKKSKESQMSFDDASNLTLQLENNGERKSSKLVKDTIMTIMSNDSIVIDEFDSKSMLDSGMPDIRNITDLISLMVLVSSRDKNKTKESIMRDTNEIKQTTTPPWYHNKISQETKSFARNVAREKNINNSTTIAAKKYSSINAAKNSSQFKTIENNGVELNTTIKYNTSSKPMSLNGTEYDMKFNNTEFMNMLFDDDVTNDTTVEPNNINVSKNHTIILNEVAPKNNTTEFSETTIDGDIAIY